MASLIAASFEYASITVPGVTISKAAPIEEPIPDWPVFRLTTPHQRKYICIEADTGSMQIPKHDKNSSIEEKFEKYVRLPDIHQYSFIFVTTAEWRVNEMIETLKRTIDRFDMDRSVNRAFCFTHISYDRFMSKIPKLTSWAVTGTYQRAGGTFSFMQEGR